MGFATDDLGRVVNVYRRFRSNNEYPLVKPRFALGADGRLVLLEMPLKSLAEYHRYLDDPRRALELGANDQWYEKSIYQNPLYDFSATVRLATEAFIRVRRRYLEPDRLFEGDVFNPSSRAFQIHAALFQSFVDSARARHTRPLIVLFPDRDSIRSARQGGRTALEPLVTMLRERRLDYVDLTDAFRAEPDRADESRWFTRTGHYSPAGNRIVAAWLGKRFTEHG
jgi:hypothetical protein